MHVSVNVLKQLKVWQKPRSSQNRFGEDSQLRIQYHNLFIYLVFIFFNQVSNTTEIKHFSLEKSKEIPCRKVLK